MLHRLSLVVLAAAAQAQTTHILDGASGSAVFSNNLSSNGNLTLVTDFQVEYLLVGGGGGGGGGAYAPGTGGGGGGGGGGALVTGAHSIAASSYQVAVGAGGAGGSKAASGSWNGSGGGAGGGSSVFGFTATGGAGGYGGALNDSGWTDDAAALRGGASGNGFSGGVRSGSNGWDDGAPGGGGAGGAGGNGSGRIAGAGGTGLANSLAGSSVTYAGGGAGGTNWMGTVALGGAGGGGGSHASGTNGLGGGGGGGFGADAFQWVGSGGAGGSGTVIVRYRGSQAATGGTIAAGTGTAAGHTVHTFSSAGNATLDFSALNLASRVRAEHNGVISGSGNVFSSTPGVLRLSGANTYTGGTGVASGVLEFATIADGAASNLGAGTGATGYIGLVNATLRYVGAGAVSSSRHLWVDLGAGVIDVSQATGRLTLTPGGGQISRDFRKQGAGTLSLGLGLSSAASLTVDAGTLELTGASTNTGATVINGGTLALGTSGSLSASTVVNVASGAAFNVNGRTQTVAGLHGAGSVQLGSGALTVDDASNRTLSGVISGSGSFAKSGAGTLTLAAAATHSGGTAVSGGTLQVGVAPTWSTSMLGTGAITVNGGTLRALNHHQFGFGAGTFNAMTIGDGGALATGAFDQMLGALTLNDNAGITGSGNYVALAAGSLTYNGSSSSKQAVIGTTLGLFSPTAAVDATFTVNGTNAAGDLVINGSIAPNGAALTKAGDGVLVLAASNGHSGGTTLSAGAIRVGHNAALGTGTATLAGGALSSDSANARSLANNLVIGGNVTLGDATHNGALTLSGAIGLGGAARTLTVASGVTLGGIVSDGALAKAGSGTLTLDAANTFAGATTVSAGTLALGASGSLASSSTIQVASGATLDVSANAGFTLASGQTLSGGGTVVGDTVIAGAHTPGFSPGLQTFTDNLTYAGGSTLTWELAANSTDGRGTSFDAIDVQGDLAFDGAVSLALAFDTIGGVVDWANLFWDSEVVGTAGWKIFAVTGTVNGFANLQIANAEWLDADGAAFATARPRGVFSLHQGDDGIYLNYTPVPEPSTYGMILGGLVLAGAAVRRRRAKRA